jgi:endogenous inhibitor of DNA gyrase (YacG/DUF329 family)
MAEAPAMCVCCRARPIDPDWRPFCSERCKLLDLARWVDGSYRVAGDAMKRPETPENDTPQD